MLLLKSTMFTKHSSSVQKISLEPTHAIFSIIAKVGFMLQHLCRASDK